jgi:hypothetical protein
MSHFVNIYDIIGLLSSIELIFKVFFISFIEIWIVN